jgi:hypothetical protein
MATFSDVPGDPPFALLATVGGESIVKVAGTSQGYGMLLLATLAALALEAAPGRMHDAPGAEEQP